MIDSHRRARLAAQQTYRKVTNKRTVTIPATIAAYKMPIRVNDAGLEQIVGLLENLCLWLKTEDPNASLDAGMIAATLLRPDGVEWMKLATFLA